MPGHLTRDVRISFACALGHAGRLTRRYVSGEHLTTILVSAVSALRPGPGRPGPEALTQVVRREPRPPGLKGRPSTLVLLQRAHPDIFEDALWAVINKAKERKS